MKKSLRLNPYSNHSIPFICTMLAIYNMRKGHNYYIKNYGDEYEFMVIDINSNEDIVVKDLHTLEIYNVQDIFLTGRGPDYELREM